MPQKQKNKKLKLSVAGGLFVLAVLGITGGYFMLRNNTHASADAAVNPVAQTPFSFNAAATNGWYTGPSNETSLAVFGKNSRSPEAKETYFAYINYKEDGVSEQNWLKQRTDATEDSRYSLVVGDVIPATFQTSKGPISYELHEYTNQLKAGSVASTDGLNDAEVQGYIPYGKGYLLVQGYSTPGSLLPEVVQAIQAFSLDTVKQTF